MNELPNMEGMDLLEALLLQKLLTDEQADQVRRRMRRAQVPAQQAVLELGFVGQEALYRTLSLSSGIPFYCWTRSSLRGGGASPPGWPCAISSCP